MDIFLVVNGGFAMQSIETRGLSAGSLYKILLIGLYIPLFVFGRSCGVASYFGYANVAPANFKIAEKNIAIPDELGSGQTFTAKFDLTKPTNG